MKGSELKAMLADHKDVYFVVNGRQYEAVELCQYSNAIGVDLEKPSENIDQNDESVVLIVLGCFGYTL